MCIKYYDTLMDLDLRDLKLWCQEAKPSPPADVILIPAVDMDFHLAVVSILCSCLWSCIKITQNENVERIYSNVMLMFATGRA